MEASYADIINEERKSSKIARLEDKLEMKLEGLGRYILFSYVLAVF